MNNTLYVIALLITALITAILSISAWQRRPARGAMSFGLMMGSVTIWSVSQAFGLASQQMAVKVFWLKISYIGIVTLPVLLLLFVLRYTGKDRWLSRGTLALLSIIPGISLIILATNEFHGLFWSEISIVTSGPVTSLKTEHAAWFWVHASYSYILLVAGTYTLLRFLFSDDSRLYRNQAAALLLGILTPWIGNALFISGLYPFPALDPTPFAFAISGIAFTWAIFRFRLLDVIPAARDAVLESMSDGVIVLDSQNRVVEVNPSARAFLRRANPALDQITGESAFDVMAKWPEVVERFYDVTQITGISIPLQVGEDTRYIDLRISPLKNKEREITGRVIVTSDVTDRRAAEEMRKEKEAAEAANQAKSAFLAHMSHELRTPLNHIIGYSELLLEDAEAYDQEAFKPDLEKIHISAQHLLTIITRVLTLSKLDAGMTELNLSSYDPIELAKEVSLSAQGWSEENANTFELKTEDTLGVIQGDPEKTRQALRNLLHNACKFTRDGNITLAVGGERREGDNYVYFRVRDSGMGMSEEQLAKLFQPFTQADSSTTRKFEGTGLGLAISQRLCHLMGGEIEVESELEKGSVFTMWIPG